MTYDIYHLSPNTTHTQQEPNEVGNTGLLWLFGSYGYVLFRASGLISEGSELLLLVPSLAGLVGGVVLPLLGAVPDGAIMLFSGLGDIETAQETLSVGVGALAGSTIMLLTVPWGLSIIAGSVDLIRGSDGQMVANYRGDPKLTPGKSLEESGVAVTKEVKHGAVIMMLTTIPYFLIQFPASYLQGKTDDVAGGEKMWALLAFVVCITGFVSYLVIHVKASREDEQKFRRMEVMKNMLKTGKVSLSGVFYDLVKENVSPASAGSHGDYQAIESTSDEPSPKVMEYLKSVLSITFQKYDVDGTAQLEKGEIKVFLSDFHEMVTDEQLDVLFAKYDKDKDGSISIDEFVLACYSIITGTLDTTATTVAPTSAADKAERGLVSSAREVLLDDAGEEEEEVPEDIALLSPEKQEAAIKKKAFTMLAIGTFLVLLFSGTMFEV